MTYFILIVVALSNPDPSAVNTALVSLIRVVLMNFIVTSDSSPTFNVSGIC